MAPGEAQGAAWLHGGGGTSEHLVWILPSRWESSARPSCLQPRAGSAESWNRQLRAGQKNLCAQRPRRAQRLPARHEPSFSLRKRCSTQSPMGQWGRGQLAPPAACPSPSTPHFWWAPQPGDAAGSPGDAAKRHGRARDGAPARRAPCSHLEQGFWGGFSFIPCQEEEAAAPRGACWRGGGLPPPPARGWVTPSQQKGMQLWGGFKGL